MKWQSAYIDLKNKTSLHSQWEGYTNVYYIPEAKQKKPPVITLICCLAAIYYVIAYNKFSLEALLKY